MSDWLKSFPEPVTLRERVAAFLYDFSDGRLREREQAEAEADELLTMLEPPFTERPTTVAQALDNLTAENWHTERRLIEDALKGAKT